MIYKVKVYVFKRLANIASIKCGDEYLKGLKEDLMNGDKYLDMEQLLIPKDQIKRITIKQISKN